MAMISHLPIQTGAILDDLVRLRAEDGYIYRDHHKDDLGAFIWKAFHGLTYADIRGDMDWITDRIRQKTKEIERSMVQWESRK